ncbi:MAG: GDP-mannose 4,6-dehydratase [Candidatus Taylorbacteria bacterium]|nr:GDP-mannose 4,6-dehydratase [Candidatus Taylorbacteria bacterium]
MSTKRKRALITGITGQDGSYLAELLVSKGYEVFGMLRRTSTDPLMRIEKLYMEKKITLLNGDLRDEKAVERVMALANPDEIYNLAAQSDVSISFACPEETFDINYHGVERVVKTAKKFFPHSRIYQASTSEMFGTTTPPQNETSPFRPVSPYGESKQKAHEYVTRFREKHGLYIASGILFNHESPRRGKHFVTRKITYSLAKIKQGLQKTLFLGNLEARRDWGFAGDYVEAIHMMLQEQKPDDFVIASGESRTVREFFETAANIAGIPVHFEGSGAKEVAKDDTGRVILTIDKHYYRPAEVDYLQGDARKANKVLGWKPKTSFEQLVAMMVESDMREVAQKAI